MTDTTNLMVCRRAMNTKDCPMGHSYDADGIPSHTSWEAHQDAITIERAAARHSGAVNRYGLRFIDSRGRTKERDFSSENERADFIERSDIQPLAYSEEDAPACGATFSITRNGTPTTYHCSLYAGHGGRHSQYN